MKAYTLLEREEVVLRQRVRLGNDGDNVDNLAELLHDDNVDGAERVACRVDEEQAAVDTRVQDVAVTDRGELLAEVCAVLVLDVLDDGVPATSIELNAPRAARVTHQFSLLIWSPYPGVSTMFSLSLTPFSTMTRQVSREN